MANNHHWCLISILFCVQYDFVESLKLNYNDHSKEFERVKSYLFLNSSDFRGNVSDQTVHDKCISDLGFIGNGLLNKEYWAIKSKFVYEIENKINSDE